jgi:hypothetical protein
VVRAEVAGIDPEKELEVSAGDGQESMKKVKVITNGE